MNALIIEDDSFKRGYLAGLLRKIVPCIHIREARSYQSGTRAVLSDKHDLILLDMTMPTFDVNPGEDGGRPQPFAGREVLRQMRRHRVTTPVILVTQFAVIGTDSNLLTLEQLDEQLRREHADIYCGIVYYDASLAGWEESLGRLVATVTGRIAKRTEDE